MPWTHVARKYFSELLAALPASMHCNVRPTFEAYGTPQSKSVIAAWKTELPDFPYEVFFRQASGIKGSLLRQTTSTAGGAMITVLIRKIS